MANDSDSNCRLGIPPKNAGEKVRESLQNLLRNLRIYCNFSGLMCDTEKTVKLELNQTKHTGNKLF